MYSKQYNENTQYRTHPCARVANQDSRASLARLQDPSPC